MSEQRILIVEDEPKIAGLLADYLQAMGGYRTEVLARGDVVLAQVRAEPPDLVLLDIEMGGMTGLMVLDRIRSERQFAGLPVASCSISIRASIAAASRPEPHMQPL